MAFDFKKEFKEFYMPKNKPEIVTVPKANNIAVSERRGRCVQAGGRHIICDSIYFENEL